MAARKKELPVVEQEEKELPSTEQPAPELPDASQPTVELPDTRQERPDFPALGDVKNTLVIGGEMVTIKPTKVKYQRNKTA